MSPDLQSAAHRHKLALHNRQRDQLWDSHCPADVSMVMTSSPPEPQIWQTTRSGGDRLLVAGTGLVEGRKKKKERKFWKSRLLCAILCILKWKIQQYWAKLGLFFFFLITFFFMYVPFFLSIHVHHQGFLTPFLSSFTSTENVTSTCHKRYMNVLAGSVH